MDHPARPEAGPSIRRLCTFHLSAASERRKVAVERCVDTRDDECRFLTRMERETASAIRFLTSSLLEHARFSSDSSNVVVCIGHAHAYRYASVCARNV